LSCSFSYAGGAEFPTWSVEATEAGEVRPDMLPEVEETDANAGKKNIKDYVFLLEPGCDTSCFPMSCTL